MTFTLPKFSLPPWLYVRLGAVVTVRPFTVTAFTFTVAVTGFSPPFSRPVTLAVPLTVTVWALKFFGSYLMLSVFQVTLAVEVPMVEVTSTVLGSLDTSSTRLIPPSMVTVGFAMLLYVAFTYLPLTL